MVSAQIAAGGKEGLYEYIKHKGNPRPKAGEGADFTIQTPASTATSSTKALKMLANAGVCKTVSPTHLRNPASSSAQPYQASLPSRERGGREGARHPRSSHKLSSRPPTQAFEGRLRSEPKLNHVHTNAYRPSHRPASLSLLLRRRRRVGTHARRYRLWRVQILA